MESIKLKLHEILTLRNEIQGTQDNEGRPLTKGLLKQELPFITKYWINDLNLKITSEVTLINKAREEAITKYGEVDTEGNYSVAISVEDGVDESGEKKYKVNPKFLEFQQEYTTLLNEEKDIEYTPFKLDDFKKMETEEDYPIFRKLFKDVSKD